MPVCFESLPLNKPKRHLPSYTPKLKTKKVNSPPMSLAEAIQETAALPLARARTLPAAAYTDPTFFSWECDHLLRNDWLCVAHRSQIPQPGDFITLDLLGSPLIAVHGKDGRLRVLSRVCPHRAMDIMPPGFGREGSGPASPRGANAGSTRLFLCPYHSWTFELDGGLKACPEMHQAEDFCRENHGLHTYPTEEWNGFLFTNLDGTAEPLAPRWSAMEADLAPWDPSSMQVIVEMSWECPFNWKVLVENFMESYHHLGAHARTLQPLMPARDTWTEEERPHYVRAHLPLRSRQARDDSSDFPVIASLDESRAHEWALFLGYPNFLLFAGPDRLIWFRLDPVDENRSRLLTTTLVPEAYTRLPDFEARRQAAAVSMKTFHLEDMEMCEAVQRGLRAPGTRPGRLSHLEMPVWLFQRYLAARLRHTWPTFEHPPAPSQKPTAKCESK